MTLPTSRCRFPIAIPPVFMTIFTGKWGHIPGHFWARTYLRRGALRERISLPGSSSLRYFHSPFSTTSLHRSSPSSPTQFHFLDSGVEILSVIWLVVRSVVSLVIQYYFWSIFWSVVQLDGRSFVRWIRER